MNSPNPFVESALALIGEILAVDGETDVHALADALAEREPLLSPFNRACAAREASHRAVAASREREALGRHRLISHAPLGLNRSRTE